MHAVRAARILADHWIQGADSGDVRSLPIALSAVLSVLEARVLMLERVVSGTLDPALFFCVENAATTQDEADIILAEWSDKVAAKAAKTEWKRAKRRMARRRNTQRKAA